MATCTLAQWKLRRFLAISSETSEELFKLVFWIFLKSVGAQRGINKWHNRSCCMVVVNIKGKRCAWFIVTAHFFDPFNHKCGSLVSFNYKSPCYPTSHTYCTATIQLKSKQSHLTLLPSYGYLNTQTSIIFAARAWAFHWRSLVSIESYFSVEEQHRVKPVNLVILIEHAHLMCTILKMAEFHSNLQYNIGYFP